MTNACVRWQLVGGFFFHSVLVARFGEEDLGSAGLGWVFGCVFRAALSECASSLPGSLLHACAVPAAWPPCLIAGDDGSEDLVFGSSRLEPSLPLATTALAPAAEAGRSVLFYPSQTR